MCDKCAFCLDVRVMGAKLYPRFVPKSRSRQKGDRQFGFSMRLARGRPKISWLTTVCNEHVMLRVN